MVRRSRLDAELVRRGLARSREEASALVTAGRVRIGGTVASKAATNVTADAAIVVKNADEDPRYVSRGAYKLAGASTPSSPPVFRSRAGAASMRVHRPVASPTSCCAAAPPGRSRSTSATASWPGRCATDPRVRVIDRTNVRDLTPEQLGGRVELLVGDLSFISLALVLPALHECVQQDGDLVLMVKPQFEVGRDRLGSGGVVRDPGLRGGRGSRGARRGSRLGLGVSAWWRARCRARRQCRVLPVAAPGPRALEGASFGRGDGRARG